MWRNKWNNGTKRSSLQHRIYKSKIVCILDLLIFLTGSYLLNYLLTYSMEQSPSGESNGSQLVKKFRILWNPKVYYPIHKCRPTVPNLKQIDPAHTPTPHFLNSHLNIILPSTSGSSKWSLSLRFTNQNPVHTSPIPHMRHITNWLNN